MSNPTIWKDLERIRELEAKIKALKKAASNYLLNGTDDHGELAALLKEVSDG